MTTYTAIPDTDIDTDSPLTTTLMTLIRDNPLAIGEGASGAPRIVRGALAGAIYDTWFYDYGDGSDGAVSHTGGSPTIAPGIYNYTTFSIDAGITLTVSDHGPVIIRATTSITVNGTIDADGKGAFGARSNVGASGDINGFSGVWGGSGGGASDTGATNGRGGSTLWCDGGSGAGNGSTQSSTTQAFLLATVPLVNMAYMELTHLLDHGGTLREIDSAGRPRGENMIGGGGGACAVDSTSRAGGDGGGLLFLIAPTVTLGSASVLTADGATASADSGGGGGGVIVLAGATITKTAGYSITYSGGTGGDGNGGAGWTADVTL